MVVVVLLSLLAAACRTDASIDAIATDDPDTTAPAEPASPALTPPGTASPDNAPTPADAAIASDGDEGRAELRPSELLPVVSLIYTGRLDTDDVERDLAELTRCVAGEFGSSVSFDPVGVLDPDEDPLALLASLDPALVAATVAAMDECVSPVALITDAFLSGNVDRDQHLRARCLIDTLDDTAGWAGVVAAYQAGDPFPFGDTADAEARCSEPPGAGASLTVEEEATVDSLESLADFVGFELTRDEISCTVVGSRGLIDPGLAFDLADPDFDAAAPVLEAFDACVPIGGLIAEFDEGAIVFSLCLDRALSGSVGWRELAQLGARLEDLTDEQITVDPLVVALDGARARCLSSEPGRLLVDLGDVLEVEVLVHDGARLWAGGIDEHGGASPGNLLALDGATGAVVKAIETEMFRVEIIASDRDVAWVATDDGEVIQRVRAAEGTAETPVELPGRAVGDMQLTADALWATDNAAGTLLRLDPATGVILDEIAIAPGDWYSSDLATAAGWLWLTNREDPLVRQLDPVTGALVAEHRVESEFTMHLLDLGDAVGVYGFSQLWRIDPAGPEPEQLINRGQEEIDPDAAVAVGGLVAFADEDISALAVRDTASGFIEELRFFPGLVDGGRNRIASDGTIVWLATFDDLLVRFNR